LTNEVSICFLIKWQSTLIYLIRSRKTEFAAICLVNWLSQNIYIGSLISKFKSVRICLIQVSLLAVEFMARYSISVLDCAMIFYFLFFYVAKFSPTNVQRPLLIFYQRFQLNLHWNSHINYFLIQILFSREPFRYLNILFIASR
jgi:hypothetical protein